MTLQRQQTPLDLNPLFDALQTTLGLIEDQERRSYYERLLANSRPQQEKAALGILTSALDAVNDASGTRANVELQGDGYVLTVLPQGADAEPVFEADEEIERVTIRMPKRLKEAIDRMAEQSGMSTNSWYVRTLGRSLAHHLHRFGFAMQHGMMPGDGPWGMRGRGRRRGRGPFGDEVAD